MPRFVNPQGGWIALHAHDGQDSFGIKGAEDAHLYASRIAELRKTSYKEIADDLGDPCTILPNEYDIEGQPARVEKRG